MNASFISTSVASSDTAATPLPAALPLFATGLGALGMLSWRKRRKATIVTGAISAFAIVSLLIGPAYAQTPIVKPSLDLMREKPIDPRVEEYRKAVDHEYNSTLKKIPEQKKKSDDPWATVRSVEPTRK